MKRKRPLTAGEKHKENESKYKKIKRLRQAIKALEAEIARLKGGK